MAMVVGGGPNGRRGGRRSYKPLSEINVTPFVDVMLVLLIIFMVTAPLLTVGVPVDLPRTSAETIDRPDRPLVISVDRAGKVYIEDTEIQPDLLVPRLAAITENKPDTRIYVRGDRNVPYGIVMRVMGMINSAGYTKVALIAEMPQGGEARPGTGNDDGADSAASGDEQNRQEGERQ